MACAHVEFRKGKISLEDAVLFDRGSKPFSFHVRSERVGIGFCWKRKGFEFELFRPHVALLGKINPLETSFMNGSGCKMAVKAIEGTFEWKLGGKDPIYGKFSIGPKEGLCVERKGGTFVARSIEEGEKNRISCRFDRWDLSSFMDRLAEAECKGKLTGSIDFEFGPSGIPAVSSNIQLEALRWVSDSLGIRAESQLAQVQADCSPFGDGWLFDRCRIRLENGLIQKGRFELGDLFGSIALEGHLLQQEDLIGEADLFDCIRHGKLEWDVSGANFFSRGAGGIERGRVRGLQTVSQFGQSKLALGISEEGLPNRKWSLELDNVDSTCWQLVQYFFPDWNSVSMERGRISGLLSWEERRQTLEKWNIERLAIEELSLQGREWELSCENVIASADGTRNRLEECQAKISATGLKASYGAERIDGAELSFEVDEGRIGRGEANGRLNDFSFAVACSGSFDRCQIEGKIRGGAPAQEAASIDLSFSIACENGGWKIGSATGSIRRFPLAILNGALGAESAGFCDGVIQLADGIWRLDASGAGLAWQSSQCKVRVPNLGSVEPFSPGISLYWDPTDRTWGGTAEDCSGCCNIPNRELRFLGSFEVCGGALHFSIEEGHFEDVIFSGVGACELSGQRGFSFAADKAEGPIGPLISDLFGIHGVEGVVCADQQGIEIFGDLKADPSGWDWRFSGSFAEIEWGELSQGRAHISADSKEGLVSCIGLYGRLGAVEGGIALRGSKLKKCKEEWIFDLSVERRALDLIRVAGIGRFKDGSIAVELDPKRSHCLGSSIELKQCRIFPEARIEAHSSIPLNTVQSLVQGLLSNESEGGFLFQRAIEGSARVSLDIFEDRKFALQIEGEKASVDGICIPLSCRLEYGKGQWSISHWQAGPCKGRFQIVREPSRWRIEDCELKHQSGLHCSASGYLSHGKCELNVQELRCDLQPMAEHLGYPLLEGEAQGDGYISFGWEMGISYEADLDLQCSKLKCGTALIGNPDRLHLHYSNAQGLSISKLHFEIHPSDLNWPVIYGRIGLLQFNFETGRWTLQHLRSHLAPDALEQIEKKLPPDHAAIACLRAIDMSKGIEFAADLECASDFSSFSCSIRDALAPVYGSIRRFQHIDLAWDGDSLSASGSLLHAGKPLYLWAEAAFSPHPQGWASLASDPNEEAPLRIDWEMPAEGGFRIHSVEGSFGGIEASFREEVENAGVCLVGSAHLDLKSLSGMLPSAVGEAFETLKMGSGYEIKGRLRYDPHCPSDFSFSGQLFGKQWEFFGYRLRTLFANVEAEPSRVKISEIRGSDFAGLLRIDSLSIYEAEGGEWKLSMPLCKLLEFRPSLLRKIGAEETSIKPLVIRELKLVDFRGCPDDAKTYLAEGELSFVNSFKREYTIFDLPFNLFGGIIGLDLELMIPVKGNVKFNLDNGRFWLRDLKDTYSEGQRAEFFLVREGASPSVDLDGNVRILIKMKQYVLFKITEAFFLFLDGTLEEPSYHLQKTNRVPEPSAG